jgi:hypothetical protein
MYLRYYMQLVPGLKAHYGGHFGFTVNLHQSTCSFQKGESYDSLLMSLVKCISISVEGEETIETWIVYLCHSEGEWARQKM